MVERVRVLLNFDMILFSPISFWTDRRARMRRDEGHKQKHLHKNYWSPFISASTSISTPKASQPNVLTP